MKTYAWIYTICTSVIGRTFRILIFLFLVLWVFSSLGGSAFPKFGLFILQLFLMWEVFFRYKISHMMPGASIATDAPIEVMCTLQAQSALITSSAKNLPQGMYHFPQVQFFLHKAGITVGELPKNEIPLPEVLKKAKELSLNRRGTYITTIDIMAACLLLAEEKTQLLFAKKLKEADIMQILHWTRMEYPLEETLPDHTIPVTGGGFASGLITGWTPETKKYTSNYTLSLKRRPILIGREKEYQEILDALGKSEGNNTLLIGEIGVGKETLIQTLAYDSYSGRLPDRLNFKTVLELMVGQLIAGAGLRADLESRLQSIVDEVSHAGNVILYIPEFQNMMGATSYQIDLSGAILPYLKEGKIPIVASISQGNYKTFMENHAIKEAFTTLQITEPDSQTAMLMLMEKSSEIEGQEKVSLTYKAIVRAVENADRYMQDGVLPGSAVRLLLDTAHTVAIAKRNLVTEEDVIAKIEEVTKVKISAPKGAEREILLHLEDKLHERIVDQVQAVSAISEALRRLRTGLQSTTRPISFLFLGPTGVGKTETAKALSDLYFGGESNIIRLDMSEYGDEQGLIRLLGALPGQGGERGELTDKIHDHPASLVLLDEFEKAHPKILNLFLQVLEDGRLTDNKGKTVSFANAIIIATSNAGSEMIREAVMKNVSIDKKFQGTLLEYLQSHQLFKPELLNRFDDIVMFKPLGPKEVEAIIHIYLDSLSKQLAKEDITATFDHAVMEKIAKEGVDEEFGARPLRRYIQDTIEDIIAKKKLNEEIKRGSKVAFSVDSSGAIVAAVIN